MRSLNHCKIGYDENEDEFGRFYVFSTSYEPHTPTPADDGEEISSSSPASSSSEPSPAPKIKAPRPVVVSLSDDEDEPDPVYEEIVRRAKKNIKVSECGTQLIFASGEVAGHRAFQIYHRQRFAVSDTRDAVMIGRMMDHYRKHGYVGKFEDEKFTREARKSQSLQNKSFMQVGVKANRLQHHFRLQNPLWSNKTLPNPELFKICILYAGVVSTPRQFRWW